MKTTTLIITVLASITVACQTSAQSTIDRSVVKELNLNRYLGTWYEIARFPHSFEKDLQGVTATYSLREDGKIKVVNQGYKGSLDGKRSIAKGKARIPDPSKPSNLQVSFFLWFYGDYNVMELDPDYKWAMIGSSSDNFFWILSRTSKMDPAIYQKLIANAKARGYDISRIQVVDQK